jgi:hypothetical protein
MKVTLMACCLALSTAPAIAEDAPPWFCAIYSGCSPEEVAKAREWMAAQQADLRQRYNEQQALAVPVTKADLTLVCGSDTVNIWLGAGLLTWGVGEHRPVWRLDRVSAAEITFKRVSEYGQEDKFFDATGYIDRVTGRYSIDAAHTEPGHCEPAAAKF